jgi:hypothetical protein
MKRWVIILMMLLSVLPALTVVGCGESAPEPKNIVPMSVEGFNLVEVSDQKSGGDAQHSCVTAHTRFEPKYGSIYWGKVEVLYIDVTRYKEESICKEIYGEVTTWKGCAEISMSEGAVLCYNDMFGDASVTQQQGRFLLDSYCLPPPETTGFDEEVLKQAAIEGFRAIEW